jgi:hypothetical protein
MRIAPFSVLFVLTATVAAAQPPRATVTPFAESAAAVGGTARLALSVSLP